MAVTETDEDRVDRVDALLVGEAARKKSRGLALFSSLVVCVAAFAFAPQAVASGPKPLTSRAAHPTNTIVRSSGPAGEVGSARPIWGIQAAPRPAGAMRALLGPVSCTSPTQCVAVGYSATPEGIEHTLADVRHGTTWTISPTPNVPNAVASVLNGVACFSSTACVAVGASTNNSDTEFVLTEVWNGTRWLIHGASLPGGALWSELEQVSCASASACTAVGSYIANNHVQDTLVEYWNGTSWRVGNSPNPVGAIGSTLHSVSCTSATACTAVGYTARRTGGTFVLAEAWDGTKWTIQTTPVPVGGASYKWSELDGVSCLTSTACMAVGDYALSDAQPFAGLAESWNGKTWTLQRVPHPVGSSLSPLTGVSCTGLSSCTAVGKSATSARTVTLAEVWDGSAWNIDLPPNPAGAGLSDLADVSCISATACTAAGYAGTGGLYSPLAETNYPPGSILTPGGVAAPGSYLQSVNGQYRLVMQRDGNLVLYASPNRALWATGTENNPGASAVMQRDGNFVVYSASNRALWATGTENNPGASAVVQRDGNFVVYSASGRALWASHTGD
jgi:hypothetical protein